MYKTRDDLKGILLRDVKWKVKTAGPSPDNNERTEIFFLGCEKAMSGNPCKGCFNKTTWDNSKAEFSHDPVLMAKHIAENAPNKYVTIGGGEPLDQIDNLIILCRELKKYDFHIMVYTWRLLKNMLYPPIVEILPYEKQMFDLMNVGKDKVTELLKYVDIIVDGEYREEERLWDGAKGDGLISSIGSGNQTVWDIRKRRGFEMKDIDALYFSNNDDLLYILKDLEAKMYTL